jgi:hypothetical protein
MPLSRKQVRCSMLYAFYALRSTHNPSSSEIALPVFHQENVQPASPPMCAPVLRSAHRVLPHLPSQQESRPECHQGEYLYLELRLHFFHMCGYSTHITLDCSKLAALSRFEATSALLAKAETPAETARFSLLTCFFINDVVLYCSHAHRPSLHTHTHAHTHTHTHTHTG